MKQRLAQWEMIFTRLLHLLAHHPDFAVDKENILNLAKYVHSSSWRHRSNNNTGIFSFTSNLSLLQITYPCYTTLLSGVKLFEMPSRIPSARFVTVL